MELYKQRILVSVSFPPDTDTPLLAAENLQKPAITKLLSDASATVSPEHVARTIVAGMVHWKPSLPVGFDGWMLSTLTAGMGPVGSFSSAAVQILTMGFWRMVSLVYLQNFYSIAQK